MFSPAISTRPSRRVPGMVSFSRLNVLSSVLLPHPDGPMKAVTRLAGISNEMSKSACLAP